MKLKARVAELETKVARRDSTVPPPPLPLNQPADVVRLLSEQAQSVRQDAYLDPTEKARTLSVIGSLALRAMEAAAGQARIEALERALKLRAEQQRAAERQKRK